MSDAPPSVDCPRRRGRRPLGLWLLVFLAAAGLYATTASRGVEWQDAGIEQVRIVTGTMANNRGLALTHPLHYHLGRLAIRLPVGEPAFAITLISCVFSAVAVANIAALVLLLTGRAGAAGLAAAGIGVAHIIWYNGAHTESYALVAALLTAEWLCMVHFLRAGNSRWIILLAAANGLGLANHLLAALAAPVDAVFVLWAVRGQRLPARIAVAAGVVWMVGTLPFTGLVVGEALRTGAYAATIRSALFGAFEAEVLNARPNFLALGLSVAMFFYNFPNLMLLGMAAGWSAKSGAPRTLRLILLAETAIFALFVLRFNVFDQYTFLFVVYLPLAVMAGLGFARLLNSASQARGRAISVLAALSIALTPVVYLAAKHVLAARHALDGRLPHKPYRDPYGVFLVPWGVQSHHGGDLNAAVARLAGSNGLLLVDDSMVQPGLQYAQALGRLGAGVRIALVPVRPESEYGQKVTAEVEENFKAGRPVVFVPADVRRAPHWPPRASWRRMEELYTLIGL